jgi:beta-glucanase (GH16 family)
MPHRLLLVFVIVTATLAQKLVFSDDFDEFDLSVWQHEITMGGGGNWEFEYYTNNRSNSYVKNGILYLRPTLTADTIGVQNLLNGYDMNLWGTQPADQCTGNAFYGCERASGGGNILNPIQSARVRTVESFAFKYGRLEIRAKLPRGDWIWPALWMLPKYNSYGDWPASGEIDIVESRGNQNYPAGGSNQFGSTLHWGPFDPLDPFELTHASYTLPEGDFGDDFHVFGLYWDNKTLYTYLDKDSQRVLSVKFDRTFWQRGGWTNSNYNNPWAGRANSAPFDQQFYLVFNVAVGGVNGYFPDGMGNKPWSDTSSHASGDFWNGAKQWLPTWNGEQAAMQIDWVKVWQ